MNTIMEPLENIKKLLYKQLLGELSAQEEEQLSYWRKANADNEKLFETIQSFTFIEKAITDTSWQEAQQSWQALRHRIGYRCFSKRFFMYGAASVAAVLLLCFSFWLGTTWWEPKGTDPYLIPAGSEQAIVYLSNGKSYQVEDRMEYLNCMEEEKAEKPELSPNLHHTVVVPRGAEYTLKLQDGTEIHLNAESSLTVPTDFSPENRSVNLSGEAYFRVKSNPEHPFIVQTGRADVKVLGTCFNVKAYPEEDAWLVTLEEGAVEINSAYQQVTLKVGEQAIVRSNGNISVRPVDTYLYCAWSRQRIVYDNVPLLEILTDLGRWYDFEAAYSSDRLRNLRFSMDIDKTASFNDVASLLERLNKVHVKINKNKRVTIRE